MYMLTSIEIDFFRDKVMSDLKRYVHKRKAADKKYAKNYDTGYADLKLGITLRTLREEAGFTQEELANILKTQKSAISRIENHTNDMRLSTLFKIAAVLGRQVDIIIH